MLLNESQTLRERLTRMEQAKASVDEASSLSTKANEITIWLVKVQKLAERNKLLGENKVLRSEVLDVKSILQIITQSSQRFSESPQTSTLVGGQRWTRLGNSISELSTTLETLQKQDWIRHFASNLFAGVPPEQRKQTIVQSMPDNVIALRNYANLYQRFNKYRNSIPANTQEFQEVHSCSEPLSAIKFQENDDVPGSVKAFFNATSSGSGANLDFLTLEVIDWLRANNMLANYVVRAR